MNLRKTFEKVILLFYVCIGDMNFVLFPTI